VSQGLGLHIHRAHPMNADSAFISVYHYFMLENKVMTVSLVTMTTCIDITVDLRK
jgi:hypothetical protein